MQVNLGNYDLTAEEGYLVNMDVGKDDENTLQPNQVGEIAEVELGQPNAGPFSAYYIMALGGFPDDNLRTKQGRIEGDLQDGADADASKGTRIRLRLTDKNRTTTYDKTRWYGKNEVEAANIENLPFLKFEGSRNAEWVREGRVLVVEAKNPNQAFNVSKANSGLDFPFVGGA